MFCYVKKTEFWMKESLVQGYEQLRDIAENKCFCIDDNLMKARANLEQDLLQETQRTDQEQKR